MFFVDGTTPDQRARAYARQANWDPLSFDRADARAEEVHGETRIIATSEYRDGPRIAYNEDTQDATLFVRGPLDGYWGFNPARIADRLDRLQPRALLLDLATPGGYVEAASQFYADMQRMRGDGVNVDSVASGMVASAGTVLFAAGENRSASAAASFMAHAPYVFLCGALNRPVAARLLANMDARLGNEEARLTEMFAARGLERDTIGAWWDGEDHFMTPREAYDARLVTLEPDDGYEPVETEDADGATPSAETRSDPAAAADREPSRVVYAGGMFTAAAQPGATED